MCIAVFKDDFESCIIENDRLEFAPQSLLNDNNHYYNHVLDEFIVKKQDTVVNIP